MSSIVVSKKEFLWFFSFLSFPRLMSDIDKGGLYFNTTRVGLGLIFFSLLFSPVVLLSYFLEQ